MYINKNLCEQPFDFALDITATVHPKSIIAHVTLARKLDLSDNLTKTLCYMHNQFGIGSLIGIDFDSCFVVSRLENGKTIGKRFEIDDGIGKVYIYNKGLRIGSPYS